jgi:hypothetical protein
MRSLSRGERQRATRQASAVRIRCLREGLAPEAIVDEILRQAPLMFALEAWRFAFGWTRPEVCARLDALYEMEELAPPGITSAELCRWEHQQRRPSDQRVDFLCKLYGTRPDRLGYGVDFSSGPLDRNSNPTISNLWPQTNQDSLDDLVARVRSARHRINIFGLTQNFYARDELLPIFEATALEIPVAFYVMHPNCPLRRDRYRIEPSEAAMANPSRYIRESLTPLHEASERIAPAAVEGAGLWIYTYNFPCSFAIEQIDEHCRVMLYGHGKRGTEGPIFAFDEGTPYYDYFDSQIRWLETLRDDPSEPWISKGLEVQPWLPFSGVNANESRRYADLSLRSDVFDTAPVL